MEHQILRKVLGKFGNDVQPFRSIIPKGDEIPKSLDEAIATSTPFYRNDQGKDMHLAYQRLNDTELELVEEPSPLRFKTDFFDQRVYDSNDGQIAELQQHVFDYILEDRKRGTKGFGHVLINNELRKAKLRKATNANVKDPRQIKFNVKDAKDSAEKARRMAMQFNVVEVKRALAEFGAEEKFDDLYRHVKKGLAAVHAKATRLNKLNPKVTFTDGHLGSVAHGYLHTPENLMVEELYSNFSRQHKDDPPEEILRLFGVFKNWREYVLYYLSEDLQITRILTHQDKQRILGMGKYQGKAEDFEKVFREREALIEQSV